MLHLSSKWYDKYLKTDMDFMAVLSYYYEDEEGNESASCNLELYGKDEPIIHSKNLNVHFDHQGSAFAMFDKNILLDIVDNTLYNYNEKVYELVKVSYPDGTPSKSKYSDKGYCRIEAVITVKVEE